MRATSSILPLLVTKLGFRADGKMLLDDVSFKVPPGGTIVIIGPNGAGKSLLLRLCHGLLTPSAGQIGWALADGARAGHKRHGMVFQKPVMLRRSVRANIAHALDAAGIRGERKHQQIADSLSRFGLEQMAERPARLLSGGEQQRLAIARAAALDPDILFLDEPTAHLDPGATRQIEALLDALKGQGVTLVMTTHHVGQAHRMADRVLFLHAGRLVEDAAATAFFTRPDTPEARAFIAGDLLW
jgi:tungstate transport system ATP-binding protein